jgi:hypothetical protein
LASDFALPFIFIGKLMTAKKSIKMHCAITCVNQLEFLPFLG